MVLNGDVVSTGDIVNAGEIHFDKDVYKRQRIHYPASGGILLRAKGENIMQKLENRCDLLLTQHQKWMASVTRFIAVSYTHLIGHTGEAGDVVHVDQGIVGTQQYAVVACY